MLGDVAAIRGISDFEAAEITEVLAECQLALDVNAGDRLVAVILLDEDGRAAGVGLRAGGGPPVTELADRVVEPALIVEAVADFVADGRADAAIVGRRVRVGVEIGRLKDRRGERDLVLGRVVICVIGLRQHVPQRAIDRLGEALQLKVPVELLGADRVTEQVVALHHHRRIIDIFDRVAEARIEARELRQRSLAGRLVHP